MCSSFRSIRRERATNASACACFNVTCSRHWEACRASRGVSLSTSTPFNGNIDGKRLTVPGVAPRDADDGVIQVNLVGPDYFTVFQVPILQGRPIDSRDQINSPPVAVVSESFARRYFGDPGAAIGQHFMTGRGDSAVTYEIVGVAGDVRYQNLRTPSERLAYLPWFQARDVRLAPFEFVLRTDGNPARWINMTRSEIRRLRPDAPILAVRTMTGLINGRLLTERLLATLGTFFALVALTLAAVGIYGLLTHLVARRVPEIGVRLALGAKPRQMLWMTIRENLWLSVTGSLIGIAGAAAGLGVLRGLLFGLSPTDPLNLGARGINSDPGFTGGRYHSGPARGLSRPARRAALRVSRLPRSPHMGLSARL